MRFSSLSGSGYSLMAVCGSKFDPNTLPSPPEIPFRHEPVLTRAAINAVQRARVVSYIERGILPASAFRNPSAHLDDRDEYCVHLILHRSNCLIGAIRCQFHRKLPRSGDPSPLFREMMERACVPNTDINHVQRLMEKGTDSCHCYCETSGWLTNPDLKKNTRLGILMPAAVWGFGSLFKHFEGISTLRASNKAASVLASLGGDYVRHEERDMRFEDPFYRGPVQLMRMHSQTYNTAIAMTVESFRQAISNGEILMNESDSDS